MGNNVEFHFKYNNAKEIQKADIKIPAQSNYSNYTSDEGLIITANTLLWSLCSK